MNIPEIQGSILQFLPAQSLNSVLILNSALPEIFLVYTPGLKLESLNQNELPTQDWDNLNLNPKIESLQRLYGAIITKEYPWVRETLENISLEHFRDAYVLIIKRRHYDLFLDFMKHRFFSEVNDKSVLDVACRRGKKDIVVEWLNHNNTNDLESAMINACYGNDAEIVKILLSQKGEVFGLSGFPCGLFTACSKGSISLVNTLLDDDRVHVSYGYYTATERAYEKGHIEIIKLLITRRNLPMWQKKRNLELAVRYGYIGIIQIILFNWYDT